VVLELLQQPDRGDPGADDQHGHLAGALQAAPEAVEGDPAPGLEGQIDARARQHHRAPEAELLEEERDRAEHQQVFMRGPW
jgi:hypothetical protein